MHSYESIIICAILKYAAPKSVVWDPMIWEMAMYHYPLFRFRFSEMRKGF